MKLGIRTRLTAIYALVSTVVLIGLGAFVYLVVRSDLTASIDLGLRSRAQIAADAIGRGDLSVIYSGGRLVDRDESFSQVLDANGGVVAAGSAAAALPALLGTEAVTRLRGPSFSELRIRAIDSDPVRILAVPVQANGKRFTVVVGATLGDRQDALHGLTLALALGGPVAIAVTCLAAWFVAGAGLRPVERLRSEADAISASDLSHRLPVPATTDEITRLARTLNSMLNRVEGAVNTQLRFVDDASHELRTPLSILKIELDLAVSRPRDAEALRAAVTAAASETDRLIALADDLLVLARHHGDGLPLRPETVDLTAFFLAIESSYRTRADASDIDLRMHVEPGTATLDPARFRQAVGNLLDNAVRAAASGGRVDVRVTHTESAVRVAVSDTGPGFAPDFLPHAFEPFTRSGPDPDGNGCGLGLAIVRAIAEAHRGTVNGANRAEGGAELTLQVPAAD